MGAWAPLCLLPIFMIIYSSSGQPQYQDKNALKLHQHRDRTCEQYSKHLDALLRSLVTAITRDSSLTAHPDLENIVNEYLNNDFKLITSQKPPILKQKFVDDNFVEEGSDSDFPPTNEVVELIFRDIKKLFQRKDWQRVPVGRVEDIILTRLRPFIIFPIVKPCRKEKVANLMDFVKSAYLRYIETPCYDNAARNGAGENPLLHFLKDYVWDFKNKLRIEKPKPKSCQARAFDYFLESIKIIVQLFIKNYDCHPQDDYNAPPVNGFSDVYSEPGYQRIRNQYDGFGSDTKTPHEENIMTYDTFDSTFRPFLKNLAPKSYQYEISKFLNNAPNKIATEPQSLYKLRHNSKIPSGKDSVLIGPVRYEENLRDKGNTVHLNDGGYGDINYPYYQTSPNYNSAFTHQLRDTINTGNNAHLSAYEHSKTYTSPYINNENPVPDLHSPVTKSPKPITIYENIYTNNGNSKNNQFPPPFYQNDAEFDPPELKDTINNGNNAALSEYEHGKTYTSPYINNENPFPDLHNPVTKSPKPITIYENIYTNNGNSKNNQFPPPFYQNDAEFDPPEFKDTINKGNNAPFSAYEYGKTYTSPYINNENPFPDLHNPVTKSPKPITIYENMYGAYTNKGNSNNNLFPPPFYQNDAEVDPPPTNPYNYQGFSIKQHLYQNGGIFDKNGVTDGLKEINVPLEFSHHPNENQFNEFSTLITRSSVEVPSFDQSADADVEVNYIVRHPQVLVYNPQFVIKQKMSYATYLKNLKHIFNAKHFTLGNDVQLLKVIKQSSDGEYITLYQSKYDYQPLRVKDAADVNRQNESNVTGEKYSRVEKETTEAPEIKVEIRSVQNETTNATDHISDRDATQAVNHKANKAAATTTTEKSMIASTEKSNGFIDSTRSSKEDDVMKHIKSSSRKSKKEVHYYDTPSYYKIVDKYVDDKNIESIDGKKKKASKE